MATIYFPDARMAMHRFAKVLNKDIDEVTSSVEDSFASIQKVSPSFSTNRIRTFCLLAAMCFPTADQRQLCVAAQWIVTLFAWDDIFDDPEKGNLMNDTSGANEINKQMMSVLDYSSETIETQAEKPVVAAFRILWAGFRVISTPIMQKRFADTVRRYASAAENLIHNREEKRSPRAEEFIALRRGTSGVETCLACVPICLGIEVPDEAFYHAEIQELHSIVNDIAAWTNDMYSFNKEQAAGDFQNLVAVVAIEKDIDVESAIQFVFLKIRSTIDHYFEVKAHIPSFDAKTDELVSRYERGLECVCSGLVRWAFETPRYFGTTVREGIPVKVLPREEHALDPGFELKYNTPSAVTASVVNGAVTASVAIGESIGESTSKDALHTASSGALLQGASLTL